MRIVVPLLLGAAAVACGAKAGSEAVRPPGPRNVILEEEVRRAPGNNLYDIVRTLRPEWLRTSPTVLRPGAEGEIIVYLERTRMGGLSVLRSLQPGDVVLIRYYSPSEAMGEFGPGHLHGAIQIRTSAP
ncbi:MAG: hypothetical protein ACREMJ_09410 [Gemmatimonadales bacterium]